MSTSSIRKLSLRKCGASQWLCGLVVFAGIAFSGHAQSPDQQAAMNPRTSPTPAAFLASIRKLISLPSFGAKDIEDEFGWKNAVQSYAGEWQTTYTRFDVAILPPNGGEPWSRPHFTEGKTSRESTFQMLFDTQQICIRSEDVISTFGTSFERNIAVLMGPWPNESEWSEAVKKNRQLFHFGPIYRFRSSAARKQLYVGFNFSECAVNLHIQLHNHGESK